MEVEIIPRLEKLVCRLNEPDDDDVSLLQAPVSLSCLLPPDASITAQCAHTVSDTTRSGLCGSMQGYPQSAAGTMQVLPDVSTWNFNGTHEMHGQEANLWVYEQR